MHPHERCLAAEQTCPRASCCRRTWLAGLPSAVPAAARSCSAVGTPGGRIELLQGVCDIDVL
jgi:hypothetical protein